MGRISQAWPELAPLGVASSPVFFEYRPSAAFRRSLALNQICFRSPFLACAHSPAIGRPRSRRRGAVNFISKYPTISTLIIAIAISAVAALLIVTATPPKL
jgi:hypothetical protein